MKIHITTPAVCQRNSLFSGKQVLRKLLLPFGLSLLFIQSLSAQVSIDWQKCLGGTDVDRATSIQQTSDGSYVVAGYAYSYNGDVSGNHGSNDFWVVKLDATGTIQWKKCLGGTGDDRATSIQQTSDGGYVMAGYTNSDNADVSGNHGLDDFWVVKLDASGNIQWQKCLGGTESDIAYSIRQTADGGYVVAGYSESNNGDVSGNHGISDFWVVKLDASGNIQWQRCRGGTSIDVARAIQQTADGGYVVAGYTWSNNGDVSDKNGDYDYWVVKLDGSGTIQWQKCLGGFQIDKAFSVQQTNDGGYVVSGYTSSPDVSGFHGGDDYWVVKLDGSGTIQWQKCLGGTDIEVAYSIQQTVDGEFVVAGYAWSNDGDVSGNHGAADAWIVKLTGSNTQVPDLSSTSKGEVHVWPNPATTHLIVASKEPFIQNVAVFDLLGQKCLTIALLPTENQLTLDVSSLAPGIYFLEAQGTFSRSVAKFVRK